MRLSTVSTGLLWLAASPMAWAQTLPSPEQFRQWDAHFPPGLYEFVDFELSGGVPLKEVGAKPRQVCMGRMDAYLMGRGNLLAAPLKSCEPVSVKLDARGLAMSYHCGDDPGSKRPVIGTIVISELERGAFVGTVARQVYSPAGSRQEPLVGDGQAFKRIGDCQ